MTAHHETTVPATALFADLSRAIPADSAELARFREAGLEAFLRTGLPHTRLENWRYTSVAALEKTRFELARPKLLDASAIEPWREPGAVHFVFVDGLYSPALSDSTLPTGLSFSSLVEASDRDPLAIRKHLGQIAVADGRHFIALNAALVRDGALIRTTPGAVIESRIHLIFVSTSKDVPHVAAVRNLILAAPNSQCSIVESWVSLGASQNLTCPVTEIVTGENSAVEHTVLRAETGGAFHVAAVAAHLERSSRYTSNEISLSGTLRRVDVDVALAGEGAEAVLNGLYLGRGTEHVDYHTFIDHAVPHCTSHEAYKGILDDKARGVFDGRIVVRPDAQKSSSAQENRNLLLSSEAIADSKPQLEIHADDVKCTHGSTIGQLDEDALFYLRARGIGRDDARHLLTMAFGSEIAEKVTAPGVRAAIEAALLERLGGSLGPAGGEQ